MPKSGQPWDPQFLFGHPLLAPFESYAEALRGEAWPGPDEYGALCEKSRSLRAPELRSLRFVEQKKKARRAKRGAVEMGRLYDGSIALHGEVFCLSGSYHDLFNSLIFAAFPRSKRALHERQWAALERWVEPGAERIPGKRTREQDALTIFDEGGVVLAMEDAAHRRWLESNGRTPIEPLGSSGVRPLLFGHALLEHLYEGHLAIRASALVFVVEDAQGDEALLDELDLRLEARLRSPLDFVAPGADSIFEMALDGGLHMGPPKPGFSLWNLNIEDGGVSFGAPTE